MRDRIFREVIGNLLIHREFANGFPAKLIIEQDRVITENWNKPHGHGNIDPSNFTPYPKNPMIARFFKEIGWVDELGSGVRNVFKYTSLFTPSAQPIFIEEDLFRTIIPLVLHTTEIGSEIGSEKSSEIGSEKNFNNGLEALISGDFDEDISSEIGSEKSSENILEMMVKNPTITISELSEIIGISTRAIEKQIAKLKDARVLKRIGPDHGGHWKVKRS